jgi:hypothetical protein
MSLSEHTADFRGEPTLGQSRRSFCTSLAGSALAWPGIKGLAAAADPPSPPASAETIAQRLHASLSESQRKQVCVPWDYVHPKFGLLRTRVANNWNATEPDIASDFFTDEQRHLIREIFEELIAPEWHARFDRQMEDDCGGFGESQSIALIGDPGSGRFQFLLTGRHMTLRCDGDAADHVAFGGPIFYGHDAGGFNEGPGHAGNVFWPQAVAANKVFGMLDGRQRNEALVPRAPRENAVGFPGTSPRPGLAARDLTADQRTELERLLAILLEPFRTTDRDEVARCLTAQGGLDACRLVFYRQGDLGNDGIWDNWRLEGPAFVWHFRGAPHVHVWVNIADTPELTTNA